jgi:hypothetical protein
MQSQGSLNNGTTIAAFINYTKTVVLIKSLYMNYARFLNKQILATERVHMIVDIPVLFTIYSVRSWKANINTVPSLTQWKLTTVSAVLLEKLLINQFVKKIPIFYRTGRFFTVFARTSHRFYSAPEKISAHSPTLLV